MIRTYKRKLILSNEQEKRITSWIGACRVVYNLGLEIKISSYRAIGGSPTTFDLINQLPGLRQDVEWIRDVPAQTLQTIIERLDRSYKSFFRGGGFPKFAAKKNWKSIAFKSVKVNGHSVVLPKIGAIKIFKDAPIIGTPKTAQVIKEPTGYFICVQCADVPEKFESENQAIGLDMGISAFCALSDGSFIENPRHFKKYERRLRIANRSLARKKNGSSGWKKQAKQLSRLHHTIGNVRRDFLQKESTKIAKQYSSVSVEDLKVNNMASNPKLAKHILDCGWGMFRSMLEYKTNVVRRDPKYTSQICSDCGTKDAASRISQSRFVCTSCGFELNADTNAAKNILSGVTALVRQREPLGCA